MATPKKDILPLDIRVVVDDTELADKIRESADRGGRNYPAEVRFQLRRAYFPAFAKHSQ